MWRNRTRSSRSRPGRIWVRSGEQFVRRRKAGRKIKKKNGQKSIPKFSNLRQRIIPDQPAIQVKKGDEVPILEKRPVYELEVEQRVRRANPLQTIQGWAANAKERQKTGKAISCIERDEALWERKGTKTENVIVKRIAMARPTPT